MTLKIVSKGEPLYCGDPGNCCAGTGGGSGGGLGMVALKSGSEGGTMGSCGRFWHVGEGGSNGEEVGVTRCQG